MNSQAEHLKQWISAQAPRDGRSNYSNFSNSWAARIQAGWYIPVAIVAGLCVGGVLGVLLVMIVVASV